MHNRRLSIEIKGEKRHEKGMTDTGTARSRLFPEATDRIKDGHALPDNSPFDIGVCPRRAGSVTFRITGISIRPGTGK